MKQVMKTNKQWYPYEEYGQYYKLEDGVLLFCPMMDDGTRASDDEMGEVDWDRGVEPGEDMKRMKEIVKELESKE